MLDLARQRQRMIDIQVAGRGARNPLFLEAMPVRSASDMLRFFT
jgi:hypothetical protein